jgi:histidine triad (HIT) family protein
MPAPAPPVARDPGCVFCRVVDGVAAAHVVLEDDDVLAFLDHRPLFPGHTLVIPRAHVPTLADLPADLVPPLFGAVKRLARAVEAGLDAGGSFVAVNNRISQSVPHLHVHVVPRRTGDGLRGFFWPRGRYRDAAEMTQVQDRLRAALAAGGAAPPSRSG